MITSPIMKDLSEKGPSSAKSPLANTKNAQPLELVCMNPLKLGPSKREKGENILAVTGHFT